MWLRITVRYFTRCFTLNDSHSRTAPRCCGIMVSDYHRLIWLMFGAHTAVEAICYSLLSETMKLLLLTDGYYLIWKHKVVLEDRYLLILFMLCNWMWQGWIVLIWEQSIVLFIYVLLLGTCRTVVVVKTTERWSQRCLWLIHELHFGLTSVSARRKTSIILLFIYCALKSIRCPFLLLFLRPIHRKHVGVNLLLGLIFVG